MSDIETVVFHVDFHREPPVCIKTEPPGLEGLFVTAGGMYSIPVEIYSNKTGRMFSRELRRAKFATITEG